MIRFRVDGRSGVPPYQQIAAQVRQALRMGVLTVGDQLPSVREVVAVTAVNPNTVLKAYRDLEREGLVEARAGHGTFVRGRPPGPPPGIEAILAGHRVLVGPRKDTAAIARAHAIVQQETTARQTTLLVKLNGPVADPAWAVEEPNLEEIVLGYMSQDEAGYGAGLGEARLSAVGGDR